VELADDDWNVGSETELHAYELFHARGPWQPMAAAVRARIGIYTAALRVLVDADARVILRGVKTVGLETRYGPAESAQRVVMTHLIERIDEYVASIGGHALLVADEHHETETQLLRDLRTYQEGATWGYRSRKIRNVIDTIHFVSSHTNRLVQAADLVAFLAHRRATVRDANPKAEKANEALWEIIRPLIQHQWIWSP
jgi:hypothetical protein